MYERKKQHAAVKSCFLLGKIAAKTFTLLHTAYKDAAMSKTQDYECFAHIRDVVPTITCWWKTNLFQGGRQPPEGMKTQKFMN